MPIVDKVLRLDKVVVSNGTATNTVHILLPVAMDGPYWLKPKQGQAGLEFEFWRKPSGKPEEQVAKEETSWHVRVGNGTIDDGVYTPHPSRPDGEYIVIVAIHEDQIIDLYASMIVPIPFVSAENSWRFMRLLKLVTIRVGRASTGSDRLGVHLTARFSMPLTPKTRAMPWFRVS